MPFLLGKEAGRRYWYTPPDHEHQYLSVKRGVEAFEAGSGCDYTLSMLEVVVDHDAHGPMASIMDSAIRPAEDRPDLEAYTLSIPLEWAHE